MKTRITKKEVMNTFEHVLKVGYCDMQYLLYYYTPEYYTGGIYGWNSDIYTFPQYNLAISTGYRPFGNLSIEDCVLQELEEIACGYLNDINLPYNEVKEKISEVLEQFLSQI